MVTGRQVSGVQVPPKRLVLRTEKAPDKIFKKQPTKLCANCDCTKAIIAKNNGAWHDCTTYKPDVP